MQQVTPRLRRRWRRRGLALVETLIVLAIVAAILGAVLLTFRSARRATSKKVAGKLAAAIRFTYDRAVTTGVYFRIVIDLTNNTYWVERSDNRFYLVRGKELSPGKGVALDEAEVERKRKEDEDRQKPQGTVTGLAAQLEPPPAPQRARFEAFVDSHLPKVILGKEAKLRDLYTPRQSEAYTSGKAYLYFFPDGHTERTLIHIEDEDGDVYSVLVHPLTGRVEVKAEDLKVKHDFELDDEGREAAAR